MDCGTHEWRYKDKERYSAKPKPATNINCENCGYSYKNDSCKIELLRDGRFTMGWFCEQCTEDYWKDFRIEKQEQNGDRV